MRPLAGLALGAALAGCPDPAPEAATLPAAATAPEALAGWPERLERFTGALLDPPPTVAGRGVSAAESAAPGPTILAFWATYCPPCIAEMPMLEALHRDGHRVVGVSLDGGRVDAARTVLERRGVSYPNLVLDEASMKAAGRALEAGLPFTLVVDAAGAPRVALGGKVTEAQLRAALAHAAP